MNLLFRLIFISLFSRFRRPVSVLGPCITPFRCWPTDLDILKHMNNSKYFSLMDLARVDLMTRAGILSKIATAGWYPVVVAETITFRKSIHLFEKFDIETTVLGWDEKAFILSQRFFTKDTILAEAFVRARFLKKSGGSVTPTEILALAGISEPSPDLEPWVSTWNQNQI